MLVVCTLLYFHRKRLLLIPGIYSDPLKQPSSFKQLPLTGWKLVFKFVVRATTCWTCSFTERISTTSILITTSIWSLSRHWLQKRERSQDLEMLSIFVVRFCVLPSWSLIPMCSTDWVMLIAFRWVTTLLLFVFITPSCNKLTNSLLFDYGYISACWWPAVHLLPCWSVDWNVQIQVQAHETDQDVQRHQALDLLQV